jgi:hypothetical protein
MFDVASSLRSGFVKADAGLDDAQRDLARAEVRGGGREAESAMARTASAAVFTEALLSATRARLQEIASVAKP